VNIKIQDLIVKVFSYGSIITFIPLLLMPESCFVICSTSSEIANARLLFGFLASLGLFTLMFDKTRNSILPTRITLLLVTLIISALFILFGLFGTALIEGIFS